MKMKTREDVEKLKADWLRDPCYDLVERDDNGTHAVPEGFEAYVGELSAFQSKHRAEWESRDKAVAKESKRLGGLSMFPSMNLNNGMTYRLWLVGQCLAGSAAAYMRNEDITPLTAAGSVTQLVDALLRKLAEQELDHTES